MPTLFVTGAGRGLGLEFARQFAAEDWRVIATVRDPLQGAGLAALGGGVEVHRLDVADRTAIAALAGELEGRAIDVLLCNAGVYGARGRTFGDTDYADWERTIRVNVMAPMALAEAFVEHVGASERKLIAMMSSRMGSMAENTEGGAVAYRSSKAALNAVVKTLSIDLAKRRIAVVALHPGWVKTDMGGPRAEIGPKESIDGLRAVIKGLRLADSGKLYAYDGRVLAW
ncbi:MAG: SDR family oxidoreductase [Pseudomonadota bacterium]